MELVEEQSPHFLMEIVPALCLISPANYRSFVPEQDSSELEPKLADLCSDFTFSNLDRFRLECSVRASSCARTCLEITSNRKPC